MNTTERTGKRISYFAVADKTTTPGVVNKIEQTVDSLSKQGHKAEAFIFSSRPKIRSTLSMLSALFNSSADIIIIRCAPRLPLLLPPLFLKKLFGRNIIIEIPTPNTVAIQEIRSAMEYGRFGRAYQQLKVFMSFPWSLWVASTIVQYAPESMYFSLGLKSRTRNLANGINVSSIPTRTEIPPWPTKTFVMIGVASLADWHAYDRVISGIADYIKSKPEHETLPHLIIVGDGAIRKSWESRANDLGVTAYITFTGYLSGNDLDRLFEKAHVALSSLGLHRKNLQMASSLKSREYTARGIPFISTGQDIDFEPNPNFTLRVPNDDSNIDIEAVIKWYSNEKFDYQSPGHIRRYAEQKLDFSVKIKEFIL